MWILPATFAAIFLLFVGLYWVFVVRPEVAAERTLRGRLRPKRRVSTQAFSFTHDLTARSTVPALNRVLNRFRSAIRPTEAMIARADLRVTTGQFVLATIFGAASGLLVGRLAVEGPWAAIAAALAFGSIPTLVLRSRAHRRVNRFEEQFPEAIDLIARALRAGHALTTGFQIVASEVAEPARSEFKLLYDRQNYGMPLQDALRLFADRVPLVDARFFATAVLTQREAGGNLAEVLDGLAAIIRDRFRMKRQVRVASAHGRISAAVLACLPFAMGAFLWAVAPDHLSMLLTDPIGQQMLFAAAILQVIGILTIRRIVNVEI